jgi:hypothetical protein
MVGRQHNDNARVIAFSLALLFYLYIKTSTMSSAFVRESDEQWLHDIPPTIAALVNYLTRENNGIPVSVRTIYTDAASGKTAYKMSNGLAYIVNNDNQWAIVW